MDRRILRYARAFCNDGEEEGRGRRRRWANIRVYKALGRASFDVELRIAWLRFLADMCRWQEPLAQVIGAIFGKLVLEPARSLDENGRATENTVQIVRTLRDDILALAEVDDCEGFVVRWDGNFIAIS